MKNKFISWIIAMAIIIAVLIGVIFYITCSNKNKNDDKNDDPGTSADEPIDDPKPSEPPEPTEKEVLYSDALGNIYKILSVTNANDGRVLVIFQNVETGTVSMAVKNYFDENYYRIEN